MERLIGGTLNETVITVGHGFGNLNSHPGRG